MIRSSTVVINYPSLNFVSFQPTSLLSGFLRKIQLVMIEDGLKEWYGITLSSYSPSFHGMKSFLNLYLNKKDWQWKWRKNKKKKLTGLLSGQSCSCLSSLQCLTTFFLLHHSFYIELYSLWLNSLRFFPIVMHVTHLNPTKLRGWWGEKKR